MVIHKDQEYTCSHPQGSGVYMWSFTRIRSIHVVIHKDQEYTIKSSILTVIGKFPTLLVQLTYSYRTVTLLEHSHRYNNYHSIPPDRLGWVRLKLAGFNLSLLSVHMKIVLESSNTLQIQYKAQLNHLAQRSATLQFPLHTLKYHHVKKFL